MNKTGATNFVRYVVCCLVISALAFLWWRLFYGVDFTDEAFYNSLPLTFARGRRPYADELIVVQSSSILLAPLIRVYLLINGTNQGIVLFLRHCFFALSMMTSWVSFRYLRRYLEPIPAILGALLILSFWPFSIPSLSYNTLGMLCLLLGQILILQRFDESRADLAFPSGVGSLLIAAFCYPTFVLPIALFLTAQINQFRNIPLKKSSFLIALLIVVLATAAVTYLVFVLAGWERLETIYGFIRSYGVHGTFRSKILMILAQIQDHWKILAIQIGLFVGPVLMLRFSKVASFVICISLSAALLRFPTSQLSVPPFHLTLLAMVIAGIVLAFYRKEFRLLATVALLSGAVSAWTSSNGLTNFPIGSLLGVLIAVILTFRCVSGLHQRVATAVLIFGLLAANSYQVRGLYRSVYGDDSDIKHLTEVVEQGAFKGLRTTPEKKIFIEVFSNDLLHSSSDQKSIAFFDFFAAGPLFSELTLSSPIIWSNSLSQFPQDRELLANFYKEDSRRMPDILVWFQSVPVANYFKYDLHHDQLDVLKETLLTHYDPVTVRDDYTVYRRRHQ